ncbi:MAG: hypothetical protein WA058_00560 [Minisyncoccia bacterium]
MILLITALTLIFLSVALFAGMFFLKGASAHYGRMAHEQERLDKKNGIAPKPSTPLTKDAGPVGSKKSWYKEYGLTLLLAAAGAIVFYFGVHTSSWESPSLAKAVGWKNEHWVSILVLWSIGIALVSLNETRLKAATVVLHCFIGVAMFLLFIGFPIWVWISGIGVHQEQQRLEKSVLSMPAHGDSPRISAPPDQAVTFFGSGFTTHCVYADGSEGIVGDKERPCKDGPMLYQYVRDTTGRKNAVTYEFIRPR